MPDTQTSTPFPIDLSHLPDDLAARAATVEDVPDVVALYNTCSQEETGRDEMQEREFRTRWTDPKVNLVTDSVILHDRDGRCVAAASVTGRPPYVRWFCSSRVLPDRRGEGIGTALLRGMEACAAGKLDWAPAGSRVAVDTWCANGFAPADELLTGSGFSCERHFFHMLRRFTGPIETPVWPEDVALRPFDHATQDRQLHDAFDDAFRDHWGYTPRDPDEAYAHWRHWTTNDATVDHDMWFVAWDGDEIAAVSLCWPEADHDPRQGWVGILGVRRPWRKQGLGLALLHHSFRHLQSIGKTSAGLGVDGLNLTGALRLYERAGMHVAKRFDHYEKTIRDGEELALQALD
jgi:mycothiol synthase